MEFSVDRFEQNERQGGEHNGIVTDCNRLFRCGNLLSTTVVYQALDECRALRDYAGGSMKLRLATIAAAGLILAGGVTLAGTASARDNFSVSIGVPGLAVGYGTRGYYGGYYGGYYAPAPVVYAPPVSYAPAPYYYDAPAYVAAPVVYGTRIAYGRPFYRPYYHARYWHR
jgi:hypothetical protein